MRYQTKYFVSPSFTHEKLEPPFLRDVIDVFEDRMRHWLIAPAKQLLDVQHGDVAESPRDSRRLFGLSQTATAVV